ncbi:hypothetical protein SDRG_02403 [Saprolegnia diclina VS20]|uniref:TMC domain-containing protein n=1 Tax=Saprolegnia diclina (strain VS20) TaxID=1156394 RepID=T0SCI3_SAPDV|nr:hypothetical protein SDRG_02403 [Saprolegnia diclina VS20]EQC40512.1 hypothetical protein SDRG_02403 [Saprolegnia diclina VS20]|eukprot:XP_008606211.1 hypothetical protein SDRG_02403 [Saprolegnia diclina VS20]
MLAGDRGQDRDLNQLRAAPKSPGSSAKVVPVAPKRGLYDDMDVDEDADGFVASTPVQGFNMAPPSDWASLDAELASVLADPTTTKQRPSATKARNDDDDDEDAVDGFVNDNPDYVRQRLEKKVQLYAAHIEAMKSRMEKWQEHKKAFVAHIHKLEERLKEQTEAFATAEAAWEDEAMSLAKARRTNKPNYALGGSAMQGQHQLDRERSKEAVRQLLHGAADVAADDDDDDDLVNATGRSWHQRLLAIARRLVPLSHDIKQIEARYGHSVAAYFMFCRWVLLNYLILSLPSLYFLILHISELLETHYTSWSTFTGLMPNCLLFPSYTTNEAFAYSIYLGGTSSLFLLISTYKWLQEDRYAKLRHAAEAGRPSTFGKLLLNAWDFEATTKDDVSDLRKSLWDSLHVALYDDIKQAEIQNRTKRERYALYARRAVAFFIYVAVQGISWGLIGLLTVEASSFAQIIKAQVPALQAYAASIVPIGVSVINGVLPKVLGVLTNFERWDDNGFRIKAMVTRLFLAQLLNILLQLWSYAMLLDPFLSSSSEQPISWLPFAYEIRSNVMQKFKPDAYACRAEQVASGLVVLVVTNFVTPKVTALTLSGIFGLLRLVKRLRAKRKGLELPPTDTRSEFLIAPTMVALMSSCTLYAFAIPLCPSAGLVTVVLLTLSFKFDKLYLQAFMKKPNAPWSAKNAGVFFIKLYWCTVAVYVTGMYWFLTNVHLPKHCDLQVRDAPFLCSSYASPSQTCVLNTTSPMSFFFQTSPTNECSAGYPGCVCATACGPFVNSTTGYSPVLNLVLTTDGVGFFADLATTGVTLLWAIIVLLLMQVGLKANSIEATLLAGHVQDQEAKAMIAALLKKVAAQDKKLKLQKL